MIIHSSKWKFIDPYKEYYLGYQFEKDGRRSHEKRCDYCRKYFVFDIKNIESWGDNIVMGFNDWPEKVHCGSTCCTEYHRRVKAHEKKQADILSKRHNSLFFDLKRQGVVA